MSTQSPSVSAIRSASASAPAMGVRGRMTAKSSSPIRAAMSVTRRRVSSSSPSVKQQPVARVEAAGLVDGAEAVDVEDDERERRVVAAGSGDLAPKILEEALAVAKPGQRVDALEELELVLQLGVLERDPLDIVRNGRGEDSRDLREELVAPRGRE